MPVTLPIAEQQTLSLDQSAPQEFELDPQAGACGIELMPRPGPAMAAASAGQPAKSRRWMPKRVVFTPAALEYEYAQRLRQKLEGMGLEIETLPANRLTGVRGEDERATYNIAKRTLAVVVAPPSQMKLQPIPPSADWQFHIAEGCPAHCQYCYLAGSLAGPPVIRVYANLPEILGNLARFEKTDKPTTSFEVSCYTDPLGLEHLTGGLAECIKYFGTREIGTLRCVTKFDAVDSLIGLPHNNHTRFRFSINADSISRRLEGGTAPVAQRLAAARRMAGEGGYPLGFVVAPIIHFDNWQTEYAALLDQAAAALEGIDNLDLTFELITHRFTEGSRDVLTTWYPASTLDMTEERRTVKRNKFGGTKYVYKPEIMKEMKLWFAKEIATRFPQGKVLYWT